MGDRGDGKGAKIRGERQEMSAGGEGNYGSWKEREMEGGLDLSPELMDRWGQIIKDGRL